MNLPKHLAIIMDGNGRWATARKHSRLYGHVRGARAAKKIITAAAELGLPNLTLFTFSTENWSRPELEVSFLMKLLERQILREQSTLMKNNMRFQVVGSMQKLPESTRKVINATIDLTSGNTGMNLVFALSYGGRQEITQCVRTIAEKVRSGQLSPEEITESVIVQNIESNFLPEPDLIIRTSGEKRLSNFFLWQAAYSEIYFLDKMWPDFTKDDLYAALSSYTKRERRFGRVTSHASSSVEGSTYR
ncbi:MAG: di-trans,poly-cis-decaprenylcistransferase [Bdellovibrionales bacterium RBG_16_40_8]|nr:MAG: di-trans,poly-cis-decaprenylcistransferase [Bdellovibrionales bacterium RBG_16_40_8]